MPAEISKCGDAESRHSLYQLLFSFKTPLVFLYQLFTAEVKTDFLFLISLSIFNFFFGNIVKVFSEARTMRSLDHPDRVFTNTLHAIIARYQGPNQLLLNHVHPSAAAAPGILSKDLLKQKKKQSLDETLRRAFA